jgi:hypothetical protein
MTNDTRTLAQATRPSHQNVDQVIDALMKPWRGRVDAGQRRVLRDHTQRIFTQAHLDTHTHWHPQRRGSRRGTVDKRLRRDVGPDQQRCQHTTSDRLQAAQLHRDRRAQIERDLGALYEGIAEDANLVPVA